MVVCLNVLKSPSVLQDVPIYPDIGSQDIRQKLPLLGILWNCLIHSPGYWFFHQLYLWHCFFSLRPKLDHRILESGQFLKKLFSLHFGKVSYVTGISLFQHFFRVPLTSSKSAGFNFGFASNMTLLLWCVCGGFLLHMLESNYLTMLMKPNYEKPVDTAQDILDKNLRILIGPGYSARLEMEKNSLFNITRALAERTFLSKVIINKVDLVSQACSAIKVKV